jgi:hypothetical protein
MKTYSRLIASFAIVALFVLSVPVTACVPATDKAPVIRSIEAPKQVMPLYNAQLFCDASDPNSSSFIYHWSASGGQIQGNGANIIWISPKELGEYTIKVIVADGKGNTAQESVRISVVGNMESGLAVVSMECSDCANAIEASKWRQYLIRCTVNTQDWTTLTYSWTATIGKIEGQGREAAWQTYGQSGNALIKVVVSDAKGNKAEGFLAVNISCCH